MIQGDPKLQVIQISRRQRDWLNAVPVAFYRLHANTTAVHLLEQIIQDLAWLYHARFVGFARF